MCCTVNSELYAECVLCMQARIHLLIVLIQYVKKEKWQFVIKCKTYCGAWLVCMHQRVKVYPGLGQSSKFIQCSISLASQPSSQQCMQRTQRRAHCSLYNTCWMVRYRKGSSEFGEVQIHRTSSNMFCEAFHHSSSPFHYSIPPFHSTECRHPLAKGLKCL